MTVDEHGLNELEVEGVIRKVINGKLDKYVTKEMFEERTMQIKHLLYGLFALVIGSGIANMWKG